MASLDRFIVLALSVEVLLSCTSTTSAARPVPSDRPETRPLVPLAGTPLSMSSTPETHPATKFSWLPMWVAMKVLPNIQSHDAAVPAASASDTQPAASSYQYQPMIMGFPGFGSPGFGTPGFGFPGFDLPGTGSGFGGPIKLPIV